MGIAFNAPMLNESDVEKIRIQLSKLERNVDKIRVQLTKLRKQLVVDGRRR